MRVTIGCDHRGIDVKKWIAEAIEATGAEADDAGTFSTESCDYPDIAHEVARRVAQGDADLGILTCGTGIGMSIAANKVEGIRAAVCHDVKTAQLSKQHNNANVLCLPANNATQKYVAEIVEAWLQAEFEGGRHEVRVSKISALECSQPSSN